MENLETRSSEELIERRTAISNEIDTAEDLDALESEVRAINEELEKRAAVEAQRKEIRTAINEGAVPTTKIEKIESEETIMSDKEIRSSKEYMEAFVKGLKSNDYKECRALLSENVNGGTVPVPTIVDDIITHAWENLDILGLARKTYIKGNAAYGFEKSATDAEVHTEGTTAPEEEEVVIGKVTLVPASIKKWISISDEAIDLNDEILDYIYKEIAYKIGKFAEDTVVDTIVTAPTQATATACNVKEITNNNFDLACVAKALAQLSDEAANPVIVMNRATYGNFEAALAAAGYGYDPYKGCKICYNNSIPSFDDATAGDTWLIVGDFGSGMTVNFPNGTDITLKYDDMSLAEKDLVKIVGRMYAGVGITACDRFCRVAKPAEED